MRAAGSNQFSTARRPGRHFWLVISWSIPRGRWDLCRLSRVSYDYFCGRAVCRALPHGRYAGGGAGSCGSDGLGAGIEWRRNAQRGGLDLFRPKRGPVCDQALSGWLDAVGTGGGYGQRHGACVGGNSGSVPGRRLLDWRFAHGDPDEFSSHDLPHQNGDSRNRYSANLGQCARQRRASGRQSARCGGAGHARWVDAGYECGGGFARKASCRLAKARRLTAGRVYSVGDFWKRLAEGVSAFGSDSHPDEQTSAKITKRYGNVAMDANPPRP